MGLVNTLGTTPAQVAKPKIGRFINFDTIKGESTEKDHKDWIG